MVRHKKQLLLLALISLCSHHLCGASLAAMAIDFGHQYMKIALVKPNVPMEVILNRESHRKTFSEIAINGEERYFSDAATAFRLRHPAKTYGYLPDLLAKKFDHPIARSYRERFPYYNMASDPDRGVITFQHDEKDLPYSVEELIGMQISEARKIASDYAEQPIKDAIITVPAYFNQAERRAMVAAAKIGKVNLLQLMNDNTAAGVNYGMFRRKLFNETSTKIMIFDFGAAHTTATIYEYVLVKDPQNPKEMNPQMTVLGVGFDRTMGGLEITMRLREHLLKEFLQKNPKQTDIEYDPKAMNKLLKEAETVKKVLSSNPQHYAQVEALYNDIDFRALVSRSDLESLIMDFVDRINSTVSQALDMADVNLDDLDHIVLMGGGTRMPKIQELLQAVVNGVTDESKPKRELGKYLNTDEAIVMGAVYQAAHRSKGFKVKKFIIKDLNLFPIAVDFERDSSAAVFEESSAAEKHEEVKENEPLAADSTKIRRILFPLKNVFPQKKKMTFSKHAHDFEFTVNYGDLSHFSPEQLEHFGSLNVSRAFVSEVTEKVQKHMSVAGTSYRGVKVHFRMDESGLLQMESADLHFEKAAEKNDSDSSTLSKLGQKISNFFSGSSDETKKDETAKEAEKEDNAESSKQENTPEKPAKQEEILKANVEHNASNETRSTESPKVMVKEYVPVKLEVSYMDASPISDERFNETLSRIKKFEKFEKNKRQRAKARHNLESFIIDFKVKLVEDEVLQKVCTQADRDVIKEKLEEAGDWSEEFGSEASKEDLEERLKELKSATADATYKAKEFKERPKAIDSLKTMLNYSLVFFNGMKNFTGAELGIFTEVEMTTLENLINDTQKWLDDSLSAQSKLADSDLPSLTVSALTEKMNALEREVGYLLTKAKYAKPKTPKKSGVNETDKPGVNKTTDNTTTREGKEKEGEEAEIPDADSEQPTTPKGEDTVEEAATEKHVEL